MHSPTTLNAPNFSPPLAGKHLQNPIFFTTQNCSSRIQSEPRKGYLQNPIFLTTQNCISDFQSKPRKGHLQNPILLTTQNCTSNFQSKPRKGLLQNPIFLTTQNCASNFQSKPRKGHLQNPIFLTTQNCASNFQSKPRKWHLQNPIVFTAQDYISRIQPKPRKGYFQFPIFFTTQNCISNILSKPAKEHLQDPIFIAPPPFETTLTVAEKVHLLASEFKSLPEPIDRVKRLLHYASLLPPFSESDRVQDNRVAGCTTTVWLRVEMGPDRLMRYRADSDSEITKGFCSCLIWVFDGAIPEEVLSIDMDDLAEMNVGKANSRGRSRVNTWHNILSTMQKRTKKFVEIKDAKDRSFMGLPPFL